MVHRLPYLGLIQARAKTPFASAVGSHMIKIGLIYLSYVLHVRKTCKTELNRGCKWQKSNINQQIKCIIKINFNKNAQAAIIKIIIPHQ